MWNSSFWVLLQIVVIPVLIGLLFELLVVIPLRVPIDESPVFLLYQDWALGLVFLKIWTRLVSASLKTCIIHIVMTPLLMPMAVFA